MQNKHNYAVVVIVPLCVYLILPLFLTLCYSLFRQWNDVLPEGFTLEYYLALWKEGGFWMPLLRTVFISFLPVGVCAAVMIAAVYVTSIMHPQWEKFMRIICTIPYALQGVILAISVLSLYAGVPFFSNRVLMLTGTYCVVILPYMYNGIQNSLAAIDARSLINAARLLGLSCFHAYIKVVVPNIVRGIKVSAMLSAALLFGDFVVVNIIGGSYYTTAQIHLFHLMRKSGQEASALVVMLFMLTLMISAGAFAAKTKKTIKGE